MSQSRRRAAAAQRNEQPDENVPEDPHITSLRARLLALPYHYEDESGVIRNSTPAGKVDG